MTSFITIKGPIVHPIVDSVHFGVVNPLGYIQQKFVIESVHSFEGSVIQHRQFSFQN